MCQLYIKPFCGMLCAGVVFLLCPSRLRFCLPFCPPVGLEAVSSCCVRVSLVQNAGFFLLGRLPFCVPYSIVFHVVWNGVSASCRLSPVMSPVLYLAWSGMLRPTSWLVSQPSLSPFFSPSLSPMYSGMLKSPFGCVPADLFGFVPHVTFFF